MSQNEKTTKAYDRICKTASRCRHEKKVFNCEFCPENSECATTKKAADLCSELLKGYQSWIKEIDQANRNHVVSGR